MKAGDGDFYQTSVVETRLRTLRKELQEQQEQQQKTAMKGGLTAHTSAQPLR